MQNGSLVSRASSNALIRLDEYPFHSLRSKPVASKACLQADLIYLHLSRDTNLTVSLLYQRIKDAVAVSKLILEL